MPTNNSVNLNSAGITGYDGAGTFTGTPVTANYVLVGGSTSDTITSIDSTSSGFVLTSNGVGVDPSFQTPAAASVPFTNEGTSFVASSNNGYFVNTTITATLPASPAQGDFVEFIILNNATLTITANTGQFIRLGTVVSASAGTATNVANGSTIRLVYRTNGTVWYADYIIGSWNIV